MSVLTLGTVTKKAETILKEFQTASGGRRKELADLEKREMRVFRYLHVIHMSASRAERVPVKVSSCWPIPGQVYR